MIAITIALQIKFSDETYAREIGYNYFKKEMHPGGNHERLSNHTRDARLAHPTPPAHGEPAGTAGNPSLEPIHQTALTDVVIVVTRYFGGIKLGAGGLIRAYGHAAVLGIEAATRIEMTPFTELHLTIGYDLLATVEHWIRQQEIRTEETDYAEDVTLHLLLPPAEVESRLMELRDLTSANFQSEEGATRRIALPC